MESGKESGESGMYPTIDKNETGRKIKKYMVGYGLTVRDVKDYLSLASVQGIYLWLNGQTIPSIDNFYALSGLFQVPVDELLCGNRKAFLEGQVLVKARWLEVYLLKFAFIASVRK